MFKKALNCSSTFAQRLLPFAAFSNVDFVVLLVKACIVKQLWNAFWTPRAFRLYFVVQESFSRLVYTVDAIALALGGLSSCAHGGGEVLEHLDGHVPVNAGVCDTDTLLQG